MHNYSNFSKLIVGASRTEKIEKKFYDHRQEKGKRSVQGFSLGIEKSQLSKKINILRQPSQNFGILVESGISSFTSISPKQKRAE